ncbi:unnamed protein product, partial [Symbiodinium natans]
EILKWRSGEWTAADDEAHQVRLEQRRRDASKNLRFQLPEKWKVTLERKPGEQHRTKDFSDIQRVCNRKLQRMYNEWQEEVEKLAADHTTKLEIASAATGWGAAGQVMLQKQLAQKEEQNQKSLDDMAAEHKRGMDELKAKHEGVLLEHEQAMEELRAKHDKTMEELKGKHECAVVEHQRQTAELKATHKAGMKEVQAKHREEMLEQKGKHERALVEHAQGLAELMGKHKAELELIQQGAEAQLLAHQEESREAAKKQGVYKARVQHSIGKWRRKEAILKRRLLSKTLRLKALEGKEKEDPKDSVAKHG